MALATNRQPPGLLSLFGVKNGGRNPLYGMEQLNATIDLLGFMLADPLAASPMVVNVANAPGVGNAQYAANMTVPQGRVWIPLAFSVQTLGLGAGQTFKATPTLRWPGAVAVDAPVGPPALETVAGALFTGFAPGLPLFMIAGTALGYFVNQLVAGPVSVTTVLRYIEVNT